MKKVGICGHFGIGYNMLNGQTIKTKTLTNELRRQLGADQVIIVDSHGGIKAMPQILTQSFFMFKNCENIIIMPAHKGLRIFTPIYSLYNLFFHRRIHYVVIGGWLSKFIDEHRWLTVMLKRFEGIYVETSIMKNLLEKKGFKNIKVMLNFKDLSILKPEELKYCFELPYKLCTFSRVMKEKGIEDAIDVVKDINRQAGYIVYCLDIYGQIDSKYEERFVELQKNFPEFIRYKGKVPFDKSVDILKDYFILLFPTQFYTEGIPGTIIDAYAAGVPVISSKWESFADAIDDNLTGIGYRFLDNKQLEHILLYIAEHPEIILEMKKKCLLRAEEFLPDVVIKTILSSCT